MLWYYRSLVEIFLLRGPATLAEELARVVDELEGLVAETAKPDTTQPAPHRRRTAD